jgi:hypothetical protein
MVDADQKSLSLCEVLVSHFKATVNKLRSLNLHFSSMFCIERKVVHVGAEKISTLYFYQVSVKFEDFSFTVNDAEDYARGEILRKICTRF